MHMSEVGNVGLTIHGLAADNGKVRADVFLEKFKTLLNSLKVADQFLNQKKSYNFIIEELAVSSARVKLREKVSRKKVVPHESISFVGEALRCIYNGDKSIDRFPVELVDSLLPLTKGVDKKFSHGDLEFASDNVVRIDDYLARQMDRAVRRMKGVAEERERYFEGISFGTFDGILKELDSRGIIVRGKLVLTAGGKEIDCVFRRDDIPALRENFEKRARIEAVAHYDGENPLPARLDVRHIHPITGQFDILKWRGALSRRRGGTRLGGL